MKVVNKHYGPNSMRERTVTLFPITDSQITLTYSKPIMNVFKPDPRDLKTILYELLQKTPFDITPVSYY
jgi:hypothetical protein